MKILSVVGARPNFMKIAPIARALEAHASRASHVLVHTGQHYDAVMSGSFFEKLGLPEPDFNLGVGSGSHAEQTGRVMVALEPILRKVQPDIVVVVGDVNSTLAAALTAKKLCLRVAHVEAGLRSFDMTMPEEINRRCTDAIADLLFTTDRNANDNLRREGIADEKIHFVGNVMIDSLLIHRGVAESMRRYETFGLTRRRYGVLTLHRPSNVDDPVTLATILDVISEVVGDLPVIFPMHPRTRLRVAQFGLESRLAPPGAKRGIIAIDSLDYLEFLSLTCAARLALTDSGGLQEETTILGIPCVTLRDTTERPITISDGTNRLAGRSQQDMTKAIVAALASEPGTARYPEKWDGKAGDRIVAKLLELGDL